MNSIRRIKRGRGRRGANVTGTFDVTHTLHVGGIQVRADEGLVEIHLANGTEITLQPAAEARFLVIPAAAEAVSIRPDDAEPHFETVEMHPTRDVMGATPACEGEAPAEPERSPAVRTGPGGDFCRDWPKAPPPPRRDVLARRHPAPEGAR